MHICTALNASANYCYDSDEMPTGEWFNLTIRQRFVDTNVRDAYIYEILIDGVIKKQVVNRQPQTFENVIGSIGNSYSNRNYKTVAGKYRNFNFE